MKQRRHQQRRRGEVGGSRRKGTALSQRGVFGFLLAVLLVQVAAWLIFMRALNPRKHPQSDSPYSLVEADKNPAVIHTISPPPPVEAGSSSIQKMDPNMPSSSRRKGMRAGTTIVQALPIAPPNQVDSPASRIETNLILIHCADPFIATTIIVKGYAAGPASIEAKDIRNCKRLQNIVKALFTSQREIGYFMLILALFMFVYVIQGLQLFRNRFDLDDVEDTRPNLHNIGVCGGVWKGDNTNMTKRIITNKVGDLNTYFDFEWPIDLATRPINDFSFHKYNPCSQVAKSAFNGATSTAKFRDVWEDVYPDLSRFPGSTFPNFQDQRAAHLDPCRLDRILVRRNVAAENLITCDTYLFGQEMFDWSGKDGGGIPRRGMKMSDHKGVMTQLVWQPEEGRTYQQKEASVRNWLHAIQRPAPLAVPASPERYVDLHRSKVPQLRLPAKVESTMPHYLSFSADFAFDGNSETFFWSNRAPTDADTFTVILTEPKIARRISIITGVQQMKQRDMVFHGILQAYLPPSPSSSSSSSCNDPLLLIGGGQGLQPGARIETSGTATLVFNKAEPVHCIKLQITEPQENWVAIAEIVILE
eukprot:jgi/Bigna1/83473/fgenesh1_pg.109_\